MVKYGVPYKGSKNAIAEKIIEMLPPAENFYDIFAGGGAITQCAMESGKYKNVYANDLDGRALRLLLKAIKGELKDETRWISREEFMKNRALPINQQDPYIACCWSFGNNMIDYLYGADVEPYKKAAHYAVVYDEWGLLECLIPKYAIYIKYAVGETTNFSERRVLFGQACKRAKKMGASDGLAPLCRIENLERVQSLERLERVQSLERLERDATFTDYREINILPNSVIYCDPPYRGTSDYTSKKHISEMDYDAFYEWALSQKVPVYISEYSMPDRFIRVASINKTQQLAANTTKVVQENLYIPYHQPCMIQKQLSLFD